MAFSPGAGQAPTGGSYVCQLVCSAGSRPLVVTAVLARHSIVTGAMIIRLVPSRACLGLIVVAARQFDVYMRIADVTAIAGNWSTPP